MAGLHFKIQSEFCLRIPVKLSHPMMRDPELNEKA